MAQDFAAAFYTSEAWIKCRDGYLKSQNYVCERCGGVAVICHHKEPLTPANINDPEVTLNWSLLQALCQDATQGALHHFTTRGRLAFDEEGNLVQLPPHAEEKAS